MAAAAQNDDHAAVLLTPDALDGDVKIEVHAGRGAQAEGLSLLQPRGVCGAQHGDEAPLLAGDQPAHGRACRLRGDGVVLRDGHILQRRGGENGLVAVGDGAVGAGKRRADRLCAALQTAGERADLGIERVDAHIQIVRARVGVFALEDCRAQLLAGGLDARPAPCGKGSAQRKEVFADVAVELERGLGVAGCLARVAQLLEPGPERAELTVVVQRALAAVDRCEHAARVHAFTLGALELQKRFAARDHLLVAREIAGRGDGVLAGVSVDERGGLRVDEVAVGLHAEVGGHREKQENKDQFCR